MNGIIPKTGIPFSNKLKEFDDEKIKSTNSGGHTP